METGTETNIMKIATQTINTLANVLHKLQWRPHRTNSFTKNFLINVTRELSPFYSHSIEQEFDRIR